MKTGIPVALAVFVLAGSAAYAPPRMPGSNVNVNVGLPVGVAGSAPRPRRRGPAADVCPSTPGDGPDPQFERLFRPGCQRGPVLLQRQLGGTAAETGGTGAAATNGPWTAVGHRHVPAPVYRGSANYRTVYVHGASRPVTASGRRCTGSTAGNTPGNTPGNTKGTSTTIRGKTAASRSRSSSAERALPCGRTAIRRRSGKILQHEASLNHRSLMFFRSPEPFRTTRKFCTQLTRSGSPSGKRTADGLVREGAVTVASPFSLNRAAETRQNGVATIAVALSRIHRSSASS